MGPGLGRVVVAEKHRQIEGLLASSGFDLWMLFAREASDPIGPLVIGTRYVGTLAALFTPEAKFVICADYDAMAIEALDVFDRVVPYSLGIEEPLREILEELAPDRIGLNYSETDDRADGLTHGMFLKLKRIVEEALPSAELVSAAELAQSVRARKTAEEIRRIRGAIGVADTIFRDIRSFIRPGCTEMDIGLYAERRAEELGAGLSEGGLPIVATGKAGLGHRGPSDAIVTAGDVVVIDMGVCFEGYHSDFTRTYYVPTAQGGVPDSLVYRFETVRDAIALAYQMIRPGIRGFEPKEASDRFIEQRGIRPPGFGLGHQVGTACHDGGLSLAPRTPRYAGRVEAEIEVDTVFTLEPFLVPAPGETDFPIGIEEMILVTSDGCDWLTTPQTEVWTTASE